MKFSIKREKFIKCKFAMLHIRLCAHHQWLWKRFEHSRFWFVLWIRFIELAVEMCASIKWHFALQYRISKHTHKVPVAFHFYVKNFAQKTSMAVMANDVMACECVCAQATVKPGLHCHEIQHYSNFTHFAETLKAATKQRRNNEMKEEK